MESLSVVCQLRLKINLWDGFPMGMGYWKKIPVFCLKVDTRDVKIPWGQLHSRKGREVCIENDPEKFIYNIFIYVIKVLVSTKEYEGWL